MGSTIKRIAFAAVPLAIAAAAVVASLAAVIAPDPGQGFRLALTDGQLVVTSVEPGGPADKGGLEAGWIIVSLDDRPTLLLSDRAKLELAGTNGPWSYISAVDRQGLQAAVEMERAREANAAWMARCPDTEDCSALIPFPSIAGGALAYIAFGGPRGFDPAPFVVGLAILLLGWWWVGSGRAGANLRPFALSLPLATAVPVLALAIEQYPTWTAAVAASALVPLGMLPLAIDFAAHIEGGRRRWIVGLGTLAVAGAAVQVGLQVSSASGGGTATASWILAIVLLFGPVLMLPVAGVYLWKTEHGSRRWLIAGSGLLLAFGSMWLATSASNPIGSPISVSFGGLLSVPAGAYAVRDFVGRGYALAPLAMLPLLMVGLRRTTTTGGRWFALFVALGLVSALSIGMADGYSGTRLWRALLAGAIVFVPGLVLARPFGRAREPVSTGSPGRSLIASVDIGMAAVTPGIACIGLAFEYSTPVWPILTWLVLLFLATRLTVRPLTKLLSNATRERDMIVAATEAERARIAADIHDDALQDLTMLVRRLDAAGDTGNAQAAREIAERLRAICGDLRLPVLDDLGVGPALEWLCGRLGTADTIELDRAEIESRLPADVELAVFRVAQEALSNAVRHGAPPVRVRYRAQSGRAELEVRDSGAGIPDGAAETASRMGHLGLMNMSQRSEAIGAELAVVSGASGGTCVSLVWEAAVETPNAGVAPAPLRAPGQPA